VTVSGLRLASDILPKDTNLAGAAAVGGGILSLMSLDNAINKGDTIAAITAGAQTVSFGAQAYLDFAGTSGAFSSSAGSISQFLNGTPTYNAAGQVVSTTPGVLPYLNLINSIAHGDALGTAAGVADIALMEMGLETIPVVGEVVAVYEIITALFGSDNSVPDPWGSGRYVWNGAGVSVQAEGQTGGDAAVSNFLNNELSVMNTLVAQEEAQHPGSPLGIIPNRMPTVGYGMDGYHFTDIDPITGVQKDPSLRYDTSGMPYNATPGTPEASMSLGQAFLESALARGAIAPEWEVQTAEMQTQIGDPQAGLTEVERAGRAGDLAAPETGDTTTWRPVVLDMSGNGIQITPKAQSGVAFNVDDSGYLKSTDWIGSGDAFLTLDRTDSGSIDTSSDLFSNGQVGLDRRGLAGLAWVDANDNGVIDASDPVFSQLRIWQDANGDGVAQPSEMLTMQQAGITSLNYAMGTFTMNGQVHQMASPDLNADTLGEKTSITPSGILLQNSNGQTSLVVTRIDDVQTNEVAVSGYENTELIVSAADILSHDTVGGVSSSQLSMTGLTDFRHGTGYIDANNFIHFTPDANYYGSDAGFDYGVTAPNAQSSTGKVDTNIQHINQPPTPGPVSLDSRPVYGYTPIQYDDYGGYISGGNPIYQPYALDNSQVPPAVIYNPPAENTWLFGSSYEYHTTVIGYEDTGSGQVHATDVDDPASSLTYKVLSQPEYGSVTVNPDGTFQYTSWKEPNVASDDIVVNGQYAAVNGGTLYTQSNLPSYAVYPTTDVFQVQVTDPEGASTTESVTVPHFGPYLPPTPPGGGGGKKPIAIDLSQQGFNFTNVQDSNVFMDVNGDGWRHRISWIAPGEGLLAYNPNGATTIDINQVALVNDAPGAQTDLQALAAFDSNRDGVFDKNDAAWSKFGVWVATDANGGTVFKTLDQLGIASINLTSNGQFSTINGDTVHGIATVTMTDGTTRNAADVTLAYSNQIQVTNPDGTTSVVTPTSPFGTGEVDGDPAGNNLLLGYNGNTVIKTGDGNNNVVFSGDGNDIIQAGAGSNVIYAGNGDDLITAGDGNNVIYTGHGNDVILVGNGQNAIFGGGGNDVIFAGNGNNLISGGNGNDVIRAGDGNNTIYTGDGNTAVFAGNGDNVIQAGAGTTQIQVGSGNNTLITGTGPTTMIAGSGNNTFQINSAEDIVQAQAGGINTVVSSISYVLPENIQNLTLTGNDNLTGTGNDLDNVIIGNAGTDTLIAGSGNDTLIAGSGVDTMIGGSGNDTFVVNNAADVVEAQAGSNVNTVLTSVSYVAPANVQILTGTGTADITLTGNDLVDTITANSGNDTLVAGSGVATMIGGAGNDTFVVNNVADVVEAQAGSIINTVLTSVSYVAPANVQILTGTGSADITLTGNDLTDTITANSGNDTLVAGSGIATMIGGSGNDTFVVNNAADVVEAQAGSNINTVLTSVSYTAPANVQVLTGTGSSDITLTGNDLADTITANSGNDTLVAGSGIATMIGGSGNDTFVVNNVADVVEAQAGSNMNTVLTSVSYTAPANVQVLTGTGTADITLTGNDLTDTITANSGNDTLVAGSGVATMIGGSGNDTFVVNNVADVVEAQASANINTVLTSVSYTAPANVQRLTGIGSADITLTGNSLNDVITANAGNDTLIGQNSNNTFIGGVGNNTMIGGTGNDTYVYNLGNGLDTVTDGGGQNTAQFGTGLSMQNVVIRLTQADGSPYVVNTDPGHGGDCGEFGRSRTQTLTAQVDVLDANGVEQAGQGMTFAVTVDRNGNFTSPIQNFLFSDGTQASFTDLLVKQETLMGRDVLGDVVTGRNDDTIYANARTTSVTLGSGNDTVYAATWGTTVQGGGGDDVLVGSLGHDQFTAGYGLTLMQGGVFGNDTLTDTHGKAAMWSGGDSILTGGGGNDFFGSGGGDTIDTGAAQSVVAVNAWTAGDTLLAAPGAANTLSLGGGIDLRNLSFRKVGNDLVLSTDARFDDFMDRWFGANNSDETRSTAITFKDWYADPANHDFVTLQAIQTDSPNYNPRSSDPLRNQKVEEFDFGKLVTEFDAARASDPSLNSWNLMNGLLDAHLSGSDTAAIGGDLAYQYARGGDMSTLGTDTAQTTLKNPSFGSMQTLKTFQGLPCGAPH
jgi:Ca2+-binding RTX toxin-like protein